MSFFYFANNECNGVIIYQFLHYQRQVESGRSFTLLIIDPGLELVVCYSLLLHVGTSGEELSIPSYTSVKNSFNMLKDVGMEVPKCRNKEASMQKMAAGDDGMQQ